VATPVLATARERDFPASNAWGKPRLTATSKPPTSSLVESSKGKKLVIMNLRSSLTTAGTLSRRRSADVKLSPCYQQPGTSSAAFTEDLLSISSQTSLQPSTPEIALLRDVYFIDLETTPVNKDSDPAFLSMNNATVQQPDADECLIAPAPFPIPSRSSPLPNDIQPVCDDDNISLEIDCSCPVTMLPLTIVPSTPSKTNDNENSQMSRSLEKELQVLMRSLAPIFALIRLNRSHGYYSLCSSLAGKGITWIFNRRMRDLLHRSLQSFKKNFEGDVLEFLQHINVTTI